MLLPSSSDLSSIYLFFGCTEKWMQCLDSVKDLVGRLVCAALNIQQNLGIIERVSQFMFRRCNAFIDDSWWKLWICFNAFSHIVYHSIRIISLNNVLFQKYNVLFVIPVILHSHDVSEHGLLCNFEILWCKQPDFKVCHNNPEHILYNQNIGYIRNIIIILKKRNAFQALRNSVRYGEWKIQQKICRIYFHLLKIIFIRCLSYSLYV